jgi:hypothetical protein
MTMRYRTRGDAEATAAYLMSMGYLDVDVAVLVAAGRYVVSGAHPSDPAGVLYMQEDGTMQFDGYRGM